MNSKLVSRNSHKICISLTPDCFALKCIASGCFLKKQTKSRIEKTLLLCVINTLYIITEIRYFWVWMFKWKKIIYKIQQWSIIKIVDKHAVGDRLSQWLYTSQRIGIAGLNSSKHSSCWTHITKTVCRVYLNWSNLILIYLSNFLINLFFLSTKYKPIRFGKCLFKCCVILNSIDILKILKVHHCNPRDQRRK